MERIQCIDNCGRMAWAEVVDRLPEVEALNPDEERDVCIKVTPETGLRDAHSRDYGEYEIYAATFFCGRTMYAPGMNAIEDAIETRLLACRQEEPEDEHE